MLVKPLVRPIVRAIAGNPTASLGSGFSPTSLFADGSKGVVYDNNDLSSFYLDAATPATVNGLVGLQFDKSANLALGAELITNGTFPDTTGWTAASSAVISAVSGRLRVQNNVVDFGECYTSFTAVVGQVYEVRADLYIGTAGNVRFELGNSGGSANAFGENFLSDTTGIVRYVVANATTMYLTVQCNVVADTAYVEADNISVKAVSGNHRYQTTTGSKPVLRGTPTGANIVANGDFSSALSGWSFTNCTGAIVGGQLVLTSTAASGTMTATYTGASVTTSNVYRAELTHISNTGTGVSIYVGNAFAYSGAPTAGQTLVRYAVASGTQAMAVQCGISAIGQTLTIDNVDLRDVSAGQVTAPYGLQYDGVDDFLQTAAVDFTATDKACLVIGTRKLSDAATGVVASLGNVGTVNGSFEFRAPWTAATADIGMSMKGPSGGSTATYTTFTAPITNVFTFSMDFAGGNLTEIATRANGVALTASGLDTGVSQFANQPLYFGRRTGTILPYTGLEYGMVICGKTLTSTQISQTERYIAQRTGIAL